jgi:hypothetical protein
VKQAWSTSEARSCGLAIFGESLLDRLRSDHAAVKDDEVAERWEAPLRSLPLSSALRLSRRSLRRQVLVRAEKDRRLKAIIAEVGPSIVQNPCAVFGRHARDLARALPGASILASDMDPTWERIFGLWERATGQHSPPNYHFETASVYELPPMQAPDMVAVFGACGSLADGVLDQAVRSEAKHVVVRACCHENLGMNTELSTRAFTLWHLGHRLKNLVFSAQHRKKGYYGHERFTSRSYPLSSRLRRALDSDGMLRLARHAVDCAACRLLIDVDRLCFLEESGYKIRGYHQGMMVASRLEAEASELAEP